MTPGRCFFGVWSSRCGERDGTRSSIQENRHRALFAETRPNHPDGPIPKFAKKGQNRQRHRNRVFPVLLDLGFCQKVPKSPILKKRTQPQNWKKRPKKSIRVKKNILRIHGHEVDSVYPLFFSPDWSKNHRKTIFLTYLPGRSQPGPRRVFNRFRGQNLTGNKAQF